MPAQQRSYITTAYLTGSTGPVGVGKVLCFTNTATDRFVVATTANLATYSQSPSCIALTAGTDDRPDIEVQQVGFVPNSVTGLGAGAAGSVCVDANGNLARGTSPSIVGTCDAEGNAQINFSGVGTSGGGATPGGSVGDLQTKASATTFAGLSPGAANNIVASNGSAWVVQAGVTVPSGASGDVITNDGAGGLSNTPTLGTTHGGTGLTAAGTSGNVLTSNGTIWTSAAPAASGAPVGAQYIVVALDATLTNERRLQGSSTITATDGGAGGDMTLSITSGSITNTHVNASAAIAYSKLNLSGSIVNADVNASAAIAGSKIAATNTQVGYGSSNVLSFSSSFTHDGSGNIAASSSIGLGGGTQHTTARIRNPYNSGAAVVLLGVKDSGSTDRALITWGAGDGWTLGNSSLDLTEIGVQGQVSFTSQWQLTVNSTNRISTPSSENLAIFGSVSTSFTSVSRCIFIGDTSGSPTTLTAPTGGGWLFVSAGALRYQGSGGTITTIANA